MCGFAGKYSYGSRQPVTEDLLARMGASLRHRGPDDGGHYISDDRVLGLAHRRLSIIDLSGGHQPMSDAGEACRIVFNGEIFNFPELRAELEERGYRFRTRSDTEVILNLYRAFGDSGFQRLNGIFAFALFDHGEKRLVLARDHFGVKPLYYADRGGALLFGSEIKAILEDGSVPRELDHDAFDSFLSLRFNPSPETLVRGVRKLQPGHCLVAEPGKGTHVRSYWEYEPATNSRIGEAEAVQEYRRLLEQAVRRQMLSDVPVGLLLSGGIDSAIVGLLMQQSSRERIKTFSIGFQGRGVYNELDDARATARLIGSDHREITISDREYLDFFPESLWCTEEPVAETTVPALYYVSRLAAREVKVVLAGQGADEPLAGYPRHIGERYLSVAAPLLRHLPLVSLARILPRNERIKRAAFAGRFTDEVERFFAIYTLFTPSMKDHLIRRELRAGMGGGALESLREIHRGTAGLSEALSRLLFIDTRFSLSDNLLMFGDKMSMANSLEMRVPFLDVDLVKFVESLPASLKLRGRTGKYIHKKALKRWLPAEILERKKRGFETPMDEWLQGDFAGTALRLLTEKHSACSHYFHLGYVASLVGRHVARKEDFKRHIFALLSFELWHRRFLEGRSVSF